jgi:hypothetical protein
MTSTLLYFGPGLYFRVTFLKPPPAKGVLLTVVPEAKRHKIIRYVVSTRATAFDVGRARPVRAVAHAAGGPPNFSEEVRISDASFLREHRYHPEI